MKRVVLLWLVACLFVFVMAFPIFGVRAILMVTAPSGTAANVVSLASQIELNEPDLVIPGEATAIRYRNGNVHGGLVELQFVLDPEAFERWLNDRGYSARPGRQLLDIDVGDGLHEHECENCRGLILDKHDLAGVRVGSAEVLQAKIEYSAVQRVGFVRLITSAGW